MAAQKGNKTAEKWSKTETLATLAKIEQEAGKKSCIYLGSALVAVGLYKDIWAYWKEKFKGDDDVFRPIKRIETIFEERLFAGAINGEYNSTVAIFGLKNNHDWKDKQEIDQTVNGTITWNEEKSYKNA